MFCNLFTRGLIKKTDKCDVSTQTTNASTSANASTSTSTNACANASTSTSANGTSINQLMSSLSLMSDSLSGLDVKFKPPSRSTSLIRSMEHLTPMTALMLKNLENASKSSTKWFKKKMKTCHASSIWYICYTIASMKQTSVQKKYITRNINDKSNICQKDLFALLDKYGDTWQDHVVFYTPTHARPRRSTIDMIEDVNMIQFLRALAGCVDVEFTRSNVSHSLWKKHFPHILPTDCKIQNWWKNNVNRQRILNPRWTFGYWRSQ